MLLAWVNCNKNLKCVRRRSTTRDWNASLLFNVGHSSGSIQVLVYQELMPADHHFGYSLSWHIWHSVSVFGSSLRTKLASGRLCMLGILDTLFLEIFNILKRYYGLCVWCFPTLQSIDFLKAVDNRVWTPKMLKFSIKKVYLEGTYFKISGATLLTIDSKKKSMAYISTVVIISCSFA